MSTQRLKDLFAQYGRLAVVTYFVLFALTFAGFAAAISAGVEVESTSGSAGLLGAAYLATKLSQPLRILGTLLLTPLLAAGLQRIRARRVP